MKKIILGFMLLTSISAFSNTQTEECRVLAYIPVSNSGTEIPYLNVEAGSSYYKKYYKQAENLITNFIRNTGCKLAGFAFENPQNIDDWAEAINTREQKLTKHIIESRANFVLYVNAGGLYYPDYAQSPTGAMGNISFYSMFSDEVRFDIDVVKKLSLIDLAFYSGMSYKKQEKLRDQVFHKLNGKIKSHYSELKEIIKNANKNSFPDHLL